VLGNNLTRAMHRSYKRRFTSTLEHDIQIIKRIFEFVTPESLVIDVGANIGDWTIPLSKKVGKEGKVLSFEPNEETVRVLRQRTKKLTNVKIMAMGLSDKEEQLELLIPKEISCPPTAAIAKTANHLNNKKDTEVTIVQVKKLDQIIDELNLKNITFVKIDVEGHELNVLKGFKKGIVKNRPVILMEILKSKWINESPIESECALFLKMLGYQIYQYNSFNKKFESHENFNTQDLNFLFVPNLDLQDAVSPH
jgi:FkbM family methyltransferase